MNKIYAFSFVVLAAALLTISTVSAEVVGGDGCKDVQGTYLVSLPNTFEDYLNEIEVTSYLDDPSTYFSGRIPGSKGAIGQILGDTGSATTANGDAFEFYQPGGWEDLRTACETYIPPELYFGKCEPGCAMSSPISFQPYVYPECSQSEGICVVRCEALAFCHPPLSGNFTVYVQPDFPPPSGSSPGSPTPPGTGETPGNGGSEGGGEYSGSVSGPGIRYCVRTYETSCGTIDIEVVSLDSRAGEKYPDLQPGVYISGPGADCPESEIQAVVQDALERCRPSTR